MVGRARRGAGAGDGGEAGRGGGVESNEVGWQVEGEEVGLVVVGGITYSAGVFGTQLIKRRRGEMQKG